MGASVPMRISIAQKSASCATTAHRLSRLIPKGHHFKLRTVRPCRALESKMVANLVLSGTLYSILRKSEADNVTYPR